MCVHQSRYAAVKEIKQQLLELELENDPYYYMQSIYDSFHDDWYDDWYDYDPDPDEGIQYWDDMAYPEQPR
jgi:hypothetical protein